MRFRLSQALVLICLSAAPISLAHAVLGESASTVHPRAKIRMSQLPPATAPFTVHEVEVDGVTIREFVGSGNRVFAIAWRGIREPVNLEDLLGTYYLDFSAAAEKTNNQTPPQQGLQQFRAPSSVKGDQITVIRSGHQRDIRGIAYLTGQLPAGVRPEDLE